MKNLLLILLTLWASHIASAQSQGVEQVVDLHYDNVPLEKILEEISEIYGVQFSYSSYFVPVDKKISIDINNKTLANALDEILKETQIVYSNVGDQLVLSFDKNKKIIDSRLGQVKTKPIDKAIAPTKKSSTDILIEQEDNFEVNVVIDDQTENPFDRESYTSIEPYFSLDELPKKEKRNYTVMDFPEKKHTEDLDLQKFEITEAQKKDVSIKAQISLIPKASIRTPGERTAPNNLSINILAGKNDGLNGLEIGLIANQIINHVKGAQFAGFINHVGGDVQGLQFAGIGNINKGYTRGTQIACIFNKTGSNHANQFAGLANMIKGDASHFKFAGLYNYINGDAKGFQAAGLLNINKGNAKVQFATIANTAKDVSGSQVSLLYNKAKKVEGFQFSLVNVCDSISGASFGILNIVKGGSNHYNRVEISGGDLLSANVGFKLGTKYFYNIIHFGLRFDQNIYSWGLGYGLGSNTQLKKRLSLNAEVLAIHINEKETWTTNLNLLNQIKLTLDWRIGKRFSIFAGPTFNVLVSQLYDPDTQNYGSQLPNNIRFDETSFPDSPNIDNKLATNIKGWYGFNAGIRF